MLRPGGAPLHADALLEPRSSSVGSTAPREKRKGELLAAALLIGAIAAGAAPVVPEQNNVLLVGADRASSERKNEVAENTASVVPERNSEVKFCAGAALMPFERRLPEQVRRFAFDGALLEPFLRLWQSGDRPELPLSPESVIVYAAPNRPYVVGYERQGCMIAILAVSRQELLNWLRPSVGWLAQRPTPPGTGARA